LASFITLNPTISNTWIKIPVATAAWAGLG
jgi:hypothetical protein